MITGARVIGVAGGEKKKFFMTDTLQLHGGVDYKATSKTVAEQLDEVRTSFPTGARFRLITNLEQHLGDFVYFNNLCSSII